MTRAEILKLWPNATESTIRRNLTSETSDTGIHTTKPECTERLPLVDPSPRKKKSGVDVESGPRYRIVFTVYSIRPLDWDNYRFKDLQDCIVKAGLLPGDDWRILEGSVISKKAYKAYQQRTEVEITPLT